MSWTTGILAAVLASGLAAGLASSAAAAAPAATQADFFVAPGGSDVNPGTLEKPFATLAKARDVVRAKLAGGYEKPIRVLLRGGTYRLDGPVEFGPADSGRPGREITYAAYPGERPALSGGRAISGWREAAGRWETTIPEAKAGQWRFTELFVAGRRATRARHPNEAFLRVKKVIDDRRSFQFGPGEVPAVAAPASAELVLLHDWSISRNLLKTVDAAGTQIETADLIGGPSAFWKINGFEPNPRYFLEGAREFLDAPGEWHLDAKTGLLSYIPLPGEKLGEVEIVAPAATGLLVLRGEAGGKAVEHLRFEGLAFEHCAWRPEGVRYAGGQACFHWSAPENKGWGWKPVAPAILLEDARNCRLEGCTVARVGGCGIWLGRGCRDGEIARCRLTDVAGNGVMLGEARGPKDAAAVSGGHTLRDSVIERCGAVYYGAVGVWVGLSDDNKILRNEIAYHPYTGVSVGWMWNPTPTACKANIVEDNHIHHVMQILSDGGGIYTLGRQPGSILRGNWIHDVTLNAGRAESNGMFLDEGTTEIVIEGNLIHGTVRSPLRFHKAGENLVKGNVLVCGKGVPPVRYNNTPEPNIKLQDNATPEAPADAHPAFRAAMEKMKSSTGPKAP